MSLRIEIEKVPDGVEIDTAPFRPAEARVTIGRSSSSDLSLPDPKRFVSSQHAVISVEEGNYFLRDVSRNGTRVAGVKITVTDDPVPLHNGDVIELGDYRLIAWLDESSDPASRDPESLDPAPLPEDFSVEHGLNDLDEALDPLAALDATDNSLDLGDSGHWDLDDALIPDAAPGAQPDHVSPVEEYFQPRDVVPEHIPDNWDLSGDWSEAGSANPAASVADDLPVAVATPPSPPESKSTPVPGDLSAGSDETGSIPEPKPVAVPLPPKRSAVEDTPKTRLRESGKNDQTAALKAFIKGVGLQSYQVPEDAGLELLERFGEIFREIVGGMMEVLRSRQHIKNEFRISATMIQQRDNNPLKVAIDVDDAMRYLLSGKEGRCLAAKEALTEGFSDIKDHQVAIMAGMQAAFAAMLEKFDPVYLEQKFGKFDKRGIMPSLIKKGRNWELYTDYYQEIAKDAQDDFNRLFGHDFVKAYETQIARLEKSRKK